MTKISSVLGFVAAAALAHAQSSTVSLFLLDTDQQNLVASVIAAEPSATTFAVQCAPGTDSDDCGITVEWVTKGNGFFAANVSDEQFTETWSCDVAGTTSASCSESNGGASANFPGSSTTVLTASEVTYLPVTITAGAEKLQPGATATGSSASSSGASGTGASASITSAPFVFPGVSPQSLLASVVSAGDSTTIYKLDCNIQNENDPDSILCPFGPGPDQVEPYATMAPNFFGMNLTDAGDDTVTVSCAVSSTSLASCVQRESGLAEGSTVTTTVDGTTTTTTVGRTPVTESSTTNVKLFYGSITVTAGIEKIAQATGSGSSSKSGSASKGAAPRETGLGLLAMAAAAGAGMLI